MSVKSTADRPLWPLALVGIGLGLIVVVIVWIAFLNQAPTAPAAPGAAVSEASLTRASLEDAKNAYDRGTAVFVDVRDAASYAQGHIPGAVNIPLSDLGSRIQELDPSAWIITYCT